MVRRSRCRQCVASVLTHARLEWIWSQYDHAYYFANEHNIASIRLHETFGFRARGSYSSSRGVTADIGQSNLVLSACPADGFSAGHRPLGE
jgi:aminoglycoside 6'-N-acetyltransferase I